MLDEMDLSTVRFIAFAAILAVAWVIGGLFEREHQ